MSIKNGYRAHAGRCPTCQVRTLRAEHPDGTIIEVDAIDLTAAQELRAWAAGIPLYNSGWGPGIRLTERTRRQIKLKPAGYNIASVKKQHRCDPSKTTQKGTHP